MSSYRCISNFGRGVENPSQNPLNYCLMSGLDSEFNNGGTGDTVGSSVGKHCQAFMASYCAKNWNNVCEMASRNNGNYYPNTLQTCGKPTDLDCKTFTAGEILIANTAARKYLVDMGGTCSLKVEPFDPTVAGSPMISFWEGGCNTQGNDGCVPVYAVDPKTIDQDPVMQKILRKPIIAWAILVNIYNTAVRKNTLHTLKGTQIYKLFQSPPFQHYIKQLSQTPSKKCCN